MVVTVVHGGCNSSQQVPWSHFPVVQTTASASFLDPSRHVKSAQVGRGVVVTVVAGVVVTVVTVQHVDESQ